MRVLGEPVGHHATSRTTTDDNVVVIRHGVPPVSVLRALYCDLCRNRRRARAKPRRILGSFNTAYYSALLYPNIGTEEAPIIDCDTPKINASASSGGPHGSRWLRARFCGSEHAADRGRRNARRVTLGWAARVRHPGGRDRLRAIVHGTQHMVDGGAVFRDWE